MMTPDFPTISILGGGLLGGSLALALAERSSHPDVRLWVRREDSLQSATQLGIPRTTTSLAAACEEASLIVLAVPVGAMPGLLTDAIAAGLPPGCLVTDVGSVKATPHLSLRPLVKDHALQFIGSHPMAGSEKSGIAAAHPALFEGAACILTNDESAPPDLTDAVARLWQSVGCHTHLMGAAIHDELVARISHLPHVLAAAGARVCLSDPSESRFAGGGLRDTTRVAGGLPAMWAEILIENREALVTPIRQTIAELREILSILDNADSQAAASWLATAKYRRDSLTRIPKPDL